jgi:heme oxygenase
MEDAVNQSLLSEENEQLASLLKEKVDELEYTNEFYLNYLANVKQALETEVRELNEEVDVLLTENHELMVEAQNARSSFTRFQIAVSMLVFVYGMLYGSYLCPK